MTETVAICVCTCMRPRMLKACLDSLAQQTVPAGLEVAVIIIDNDPAQSAAQVAAFHERESPLMTLYAHEPRRGISFARNAALDVAVKIGADWVAFIDDDETAATDWLDRLMVPEYRTIPVLMGRQVLVYPSPSPFWATKRTKRVKAEGRQLTTAYTHNVRFAMRLVHAGLRFNESLGLMGGEDQEFFTHAAAAGFEIRQTQAAITFETAHRERLTWMAQASRSYWCAASDMRRAVLEKGMMRAVLAKAHTVPVSCLFGLMEMAASPLFVIAGPKAFKKRALAGGCKIGKGLGRLAAMLGHLPQPYARVVGE